MNLRRILWLCLLLLVMTRPASAAYGFVQIQVSGFVGAVSTAATPSFTLGAAHLLVVKCVVVNASIPATTCLTMTDVLGNSFIKAGASRGTSATLNGGEGSEYWYSLNTLGGTDVVTATTAAGNGNFDIEALEYSGIQTVGAFDVANNNAGSGSLETVTVGTLFSDDLVVAGFESSGSGWTWTAPMTARSPGDSRGGDREAPSAGVYTPTATGGPFIWIGSIITFKIAPVGIGGSFIGGPSFVLGPSVVK